MELEINSQNKAIIKYIIKNFCPEYKLCSKGHIENKINFSPDKARKDGVGLSRLVQDARDWSRYCVNRCTLSYPPLTTTSHVDI